MSAFALLLTSNSRNFQTNNSAYETYADRKRKWFDSLSIEEKNNVLTTVKDLCEAINKNEQERYNEEIRYYERLLTNYNKKSWFSKLFSNAPVKPADVKPIVCNRFWDEGWCIVWDMYGLGYTGN